MIALGPIFQAVGAVVDLIIEAVENFHLVSVIRKVIDGLDLIIEAVENFSDD